MASKRGRRLRTLAIVVGALVVIGIAVHLVVSALGRRAFERSQAAWSAYGRPHDVFLRRFPTTDTNDSARALKELVAPLGCDLHPVQLEGARPTLGRKAEIDAVRAWLRSTLEEPSGRILDAPDDVAATMEEMASTLNSVAGHLLSAERPIWTSEPGRAGRGPYPNLLGIMQLGDLLVARGLLQAHSGNHELAYDLLEASWRLNSSLEQRPELICLLIEMAGARRFAIAVRKMPDLSESWRDRLTSVDYRPRAIDALQFEWLFHETAHGLFPQASLVWALRPTGEGDSFIEALGETIPAGWARFSLAETSGAWLQVLVALDTAAPCSPTVWHPPQPVLSAWNVPGEVVMATNMANVVWVAELGVGLQAELTLRVHEARSRAADGHLSHEDLLELGRPSKCQMGGWLVEDAGSGSFRVSWRGGEEHPYFQTESSRIGASWSYFE